MQRGYPLHLRNAAAGQLGRPRNAHACLPEPDDALVERRVRLAAFVPACRFRNLDPFALALAPRLVVVARGLERDSQQHVLHRFEHDARYTGTVRYEIRQVHDPGTASCRGSQSEFILLANSAVGCSN